MPLETLAIYLWFGGIALAALGGLWLWINAFRTHWAWGLSFLLGFPALIFVFVRFRRAIGPLILSLLGVGCISAAVVVAMNSIDLGEREKMVDGEKHIILKGWDKKADDYQFLRFKNDTIVLIMGNLDVTDKTLEYLAGMSQLRELDLNDTDITDAGLIQLKKLPALRNLNLARTKITDEGFRTHLLPMASLEKLDLTKTGVAPETAKEWKKGKSERKCLGP